MVYQPIQHMRCFMAGRRNDTQAEGAVLVGDMSIEAKSGIVAIARIDLAGSVPATPETDDLANFHNQLVMQAGAYQNGTFVVGVAKFGLEEGVDQIGQSCVIAPSGEVMVQCTTLGDELQVARCDLDFCAVYKDNICNFGKHRRPEYYRLIVERTGAGEMLGQ
jgi:predicted amidohydrolase